MVACTGCAQQEASQYPSIEWEEAQEPLSLAEELLTVGEGDLVFCMNAVPG